MSQVLKVNTPPGTTSGTQLAADVDARTDAFLTMHSGPSRPSYAKAGTMWLKGDVDPRVLYHYTGLVDVKIAEITSAGVLSLNVTPAIPLASAEITDFNAATTNGMFWAQSTAANSPAAAFFRVLVFGAAAGNASHIAVNGAGTEQYFRSRTAGVWSAWRRNVTAAEIGAAASKGFTDDETLADASATDAVSERAVKAYVDGLALGVDQEWQDVTASRVLGTTYQNTTGRTIAVAGRTTGSGADNWQVSTDGSAWVSVGMLTGNGDTHSAFFVVPPGHYYRANASRTIEYWSELR